MNITAEINRAARREWSEDEIVVGAPATHYVGSDSYAAIVVGVERFKTGARAGRIKAIIACNADVQEDGSLKPRPHVKWHFPEDGEPYTAPEYDRFLSKDYTRSNRRWNEALGQFVTEEETYTRYCERSEGRVAWWSSLVVGYADDYRDPHF